MNGARGLAVLLLVLLAIAPVQADDPEARAIMEQVDALDDGDNSVASMEMVLVDRRGNERLRRLRSFARDDGDDTLRVMFFTYPPDVAGTAFLTHDHAGSERDDDQWLYLPALDKTRRIAAASQSGSFMGSDFSYADLSTRDLDDYDYTMVQESDVAGAKVWVIEAVPRSAEVVEETGYSKSLLLVRQDNHFVVRAVHWVDGSSDLKYMDVKALETIDGILVATEIHMNTKRNRETRHRTVLRLSEVRFGQELDDDLFTVSRLPRGP